MAIHSVVTVKQVPDTAHLSTDTMKEDGTVNRAALPAIINPEDLNALEEALRFKEKYGGTVTVISMGPPSAQESLMECYYRGADRLILLSDMAFAASDTLATSRILAAAIRKLGVIHLIFCGRQAIDGDTGQVGPQLAQKLGLNQLTFVSEIIDSGSSSIKVRRINESGYEILQAPFPVLLTIDADANHSRPVNVKRLMAHKEYIFDSENELFTHWTQDDMGLTGELCGVSGSPTKVKEIENVVLEAHDIQKIPMTEEGINGLIHELRTEHIIG